MRKLLIRGGTILSMDDEVGELERGDVLVEGDAIAAIAPRIDADDAEVIDAAGAIVMPGLVNAHQHTWQGGIRAIGADWASGGYFAHVHTGLSPAYTPEDTYIGTLAGALAQLDAGTTTLFDWCHNNATPAHTDAAIDALSEAGIRAIFGHGTVKPKPRPGEPHFSTIPHPVAEIERLRKGRLSVDTALVTLAACILGPDYSTLEVCRHDFRMARDYGLLSSAHIWGLPNRLVEGGYRTIAAEGLLGPDHNIVHANYIDDEELKAILDSGATITATPTVEFQGHPVEPLTSRVLRMGGRPSIGPDTEVDLPGGMLEATRIALLIARHYNAIDAERRLDASGEAPERKMEIAVAATRVREPPVQTRDALRWATIDNARALRIDHRTGSLAAGKQADLIVVSRDGLHMLSTIDPAQAVLHFAQNADISTVVVGGAVRKRDGVLQGIDREALIRRLAASTERVIGGYAPPISWP